jgi:hypothetical protein
MICFFCERQAEDDAVGQELHRQLEAAGKFVNFSACV